MMRMKGKTNELSSSSSSSATETRPVDWEVRPGGMLVQKRTDGQSTTAPPRTIRLRVKYKSTYHEVTINSQATFGELKKLLTGPTGLHHQDQKLYYKGKERGCKEFLDLVGVKDKSKIVLVEDPISQEKRYLEMRKNAKMEKAAKLISEITLEVDRLASQVSELESTISKGGKVAETDVLNLIELLMNQVLRLDGIMAEGDVKLQRKMQVARVQKYVETLDLLKVKISMPSKTGEITSRRTRHSNGHRLQPIQEEQPEKNCKQRSNGNGNASIHGQNDRRQSNGTGYNLSREQQPSINLMDDLAGYQQKQQPQQKSPSGTVVTTQWETFDSTAALAPVPATSTSDSTKYSDRPSFNWDLL